MEGEGDCGVGCYGGEGIHHLCLNMAYKLSQGCVKLPFVCVRLKEGVGKMEAGFAGEGGGWLCTPLYPRFDIIVHCLNVKREKGKKKTRKITAYEKMPSMKLRTIQNWIVWSMLVVAYAGVIRDDIQ